MTPMIITCIFAFSFAFPVALFIGTAYRVWQKGEHVDITSLERLIDTIRKVITFRDVDNDDDLFMITEHQFTCYAPKVR